MSVKLVIFDCDGVLVDSEPATNRVIASDLVQRGLTLSDDYVAAHFVGGTIKDVAVQACKMGADLPSDWVDLIYQKMFAALREGVPLFPDVGVFLDALDTKGIAYAISSNGPMAKMDITLTPSGLTNRFAARIYSGHDYPPKPAPDMIQHAMQMAGVTPAQTVFIDDSASGAKAGIAAGVRTFGFDPTGQFTHLGDLPVKRVSSMRQIADLIGVPMTPPDSKSDGFTAFARPV